MKNQLLISILLKIVILHTLAQSTTEISIAKEYLNVGELEKAEVIYQESVKKLQLIPLIFTDYCDLLQKLEKEKEAEQFIIEVTKKFPNNYQYKVALVKYYDKSLQQEKKDSIIKAIEDQFSANAFQISLLAQSFYNNQLYAESIKFFLLSRKLRTQPSLHALELASLYRMTGNEGMMIEEYLKYGSGNVNRLNYVKNLLQNFIKEEKDLQKMEETILAKMQSSPEDLEYPELLLWIELQRKNFYGAFVQARAIDLRNDSPGDRSMYIGVIALENKAYLDAEEIFDYVASSYPQQRNYARAKKYLLQAKESRLTADLKIQNEEIRSLAKDYRKLYQETYPSNAGMEALRMKALLHTFYLDELDSSVLLLQRLIQDQKSSFQLKSILKLDLADVYLMKEQPWDASLLYYQVEKANKNKPIAYDAKLKNARLNYFTGNFALAKGHLDILKKNTTRNIANDAISLGMLITDNTALDTTDVVMKRFANVEKLIFQKKVDVAESELLALLEDYPYHGIIDEVYWLLSKLALQNQNPESSLKYLDLLLESYPYDILADDAAFKRAIIHHKYLENETIALEYYQSFLKDYPGSMYVAEARKNFRLLRGDKLN